MKTLKNALKFYSFGLIFFIFITHCFHIFSSLNVERYIMVFFIFLKLTVQGYIEMHARPFTVSYHWCTVDFHKSQIIWAIFYPTHCLYHYLLSSQTGDFLAEGGFVFWVI